MRADNIQIKCEQWQITIAPDGDMNDVNFFSKDSIASKVKLKEIDLMPYCLDDEFPISSGGEDIDLSSDNASLELYRKYGNINLKLSNIKSVNLANSFFRIYDNNYQVITAPYIRYKVKVFINGSLKFQGVLTPFDLKHYFPKEIDLREVIEIPIYSWDKEMEDYYSNKKMPDLSALGSPVNNIWSSTYTLPAYGSLAFDNCSIQELMIYGYGLPSNTVQYDYGVNNDTWLGFWRISRRPLIIKGFNTYDAPIYIFATGYDYVRENLSYSMFDYLKYMCNAHGWVFYWEIIDNELKLMIRNRVTADSFANHSELVLDYNKIIDFETGFTEYSVPVSTVKISIVEFTGNGKAFEGGGSFFSGDANQFKGAGDRVFTNLDIPEPSENVVFFNKIQITSAPKIIVDWDNDYVHSRYSDNNADKQHYLEFKNINIGAGRGLTVNKNLYFEGDDLLHIKAGDNFFDLNKKRRYDLDDASEGDYNAGDEIEDYWLIYAGNIATSMFYGNGDKRPFLSVKNGFSNSIEGHYQSNQYEWNNMALLSDNTNRVIDIEVYGIYDENNSSVSFNNISGTDDENKFSGTFDILERTVEYISEVTKLKIKKRLEIE